MDRNTRHIWIERYFEGELSVAEEHILLDSLLTCKELDSEELEVLAVMGYARIATSEGTVPKKTSSRGLHTQTRWMMKVAASVAVVAVLTVVVSMLFGTSHTSGCFAYVGGERINDRELVMQMMTDQLNEMSEASVNITDQIERDMDDFRNAIGHDDLINESEKIQL